MEISPWLSDDAMVVDVCSLKVLPCKWMEEILPKTVQIVGTHPLFGPQSAPESIKGQKVAVCEVRGNSAKVVGFLEGLGLTVIRCDAEEHDRQMAVSQALTHFIGQGMVQGGFGKVELSTKTFESLMDVVKIIGGNTRELFEDMHRLNPYAAEVRQRFIDGCRQVEFDVTK